jgi:hypothetical protein
MNKLLIAATLLLVGCSSNDINGSGITDGKSSEACVAGFVEDTPGAGTLDIYFPSGFSPDVQSIKDVSIEVAKEVTEQLGAC